MGKVRNSLILLLTIGAICLLACLPRITGWFQDRTSLEQVDYQESAQVQLEIRKDMPLMGKLSLLCRMDGVIEVPTALAEMTEEEAENAALAALQPYIDGGLIPEFAVWSIEARPILIQTADTADLTGLIWAVNISGKPDGLPYISLDIDDATGALLRLNVSCENWDAADLEGCLTRFTEIYFAGLDLEQYEQFATDDLENRYIGDDTVGIRYRFGDVVYGEVNLDLFVHRYGFYVDTPYV